MHEDDDEHLPRGGSYELWLGGGERMTSTLACNLEMEDENEEEKRVGGSFVLGGIVMDGSS